MIRIVLCAAVVCLAGSASAQPKPKAPPPPPPVAYKLPIVNQPLPINGEEGWPTNLTWMYDVPNVKDAAGKVVIHWFCAPKLAGCTDDLARITTLKETLPNVYVIAYINTTNKAEAKKLDPIRDSEGVGRGTVAYGAPTAKFFKTLGITGPVSFVVGVDNKLLQITNGSTPADLDGRDAKVTSLVAGIKLYTAKLDGPATIKATAKFDLSLTITLASWLVYSKKPGTTMDFKATVPKEITCTNTTLKGDQLVAVNQTMVAKMTCSGPKGSYEAAAQIQFGYDVPSGATGIGADGGKWKFEITN